MSEKKWQERKPADVVELWQELHRKMQEIERLENELFMLRAEAEFATYPVTEEEFE